MRRRLRGGLGGGEAGVEQAQGSIGQGASGPLAGALPGVTAVGAAAALAGFGAAVVAVCSELPSCRSRALHHRLLLVAAAFVVVG